MQNSMFSKINIKRSEILKSPTKSQKKLPKSPMSTKEFEPTFFDRLKKFDENPHEVSMELRHSVFEYKIDETESNTSNFDNEDSFCLQNLSMSMPLYDNKNKVNNASNTTKIAEEQSNLLDTPNANALFSFSLNSNFENKENLEREIKPFGGNEYSDDSTNIVLTPLVVSDEEQEKEGNCSSSSREDSKLQEKMKELLEERLEFLKFYEENLDSKNVHVDKIEQEMIGDQLVNIHKIDKQLQRVSCNFVDYLTKIENCCYEKNNFLEKLSKIQNRQKYLKMLHDRLRTSKGLPSDDLKQLKELVSTFNHPKNDSNSKFSEFSQNQKQAYYQSFIRLINSFILKSSQNKHSPIFSDLKSIEEEL